MPLPQLKGLLGRARQRGRRETLGDAERYHREAKVSALRRGVRNKWAYVTGIVKRRLGLGRKKRRQLGSK